MTQGYIGWQEREVRLDDSIVASWLKPLEEVRMIRDEGGNLTLKLQFTWNGEVNTLTLFFDTLDQYKDYDLDAPDKEVVGKVSCHLFKDHYEDIFLFGTWEEYQKDHVWWAKIIDSSVLGSLE